MKDIEIIKKVNELNKDILTIEDLSKILGVKKKGLRTKISRLTDKDVLQRVGHGLYTVFGKTVIPEEVASQLYSPSYLSLKTVLSKEGIINQIPNEIYLVTPRKTYQTKILNTKINYRKISEDLYFGYYLKNGIPIAYPEKALLDLIYFVTLGKETANFDEMDLDQINKQRLNKLLESFPRKIIKATKKLI